MLTQPQGDAASNLALVHLGAAAPTPVVLVVDDGCAVSGSLRRSLAPEFRVEKATPAEALTRAVALRPDAVVCDSAHAEEPGRSLLSGLRAQLELAHTPIVALTTAADDASRGQLFTAGADDYLTTPFAVEEARARIRNLIGARRADAKNRRLVLQVREQDEQLRYLSDHDQLTGLFNRRRLLEELERHVKATRRFDGLGALLAFDLDHFKYVNDALGPAVGDQLIAGIAQLLRDGVRSSDVLARLGGDEFAVLLPHADFAKAVEVADDLRRTLREHLQVLPEGRSLRVTASVGVAVVTGSPEETGADVLVRADVAMHDAKDAGRDRIALSRAPQRPESGTRARLTWIERIRQALDQDRFCLFAQPIQPTRPQDGAAYELLLRLRGEEGQLLAPAAFLPIAERLDLVQEIDRWVVAHALELLAGQPEDEKLSIEVNLSGRSIGDPMLLELIETATRRHLIDPARLVLEITETGAVENFPAARAFAERLAELGCRFALDDFGAGFGSFYYLKHPPVRFLED